MPRSSRERGTHDRPRREVETKEGSDCGGGDDGGGGGSGGGGDGDIQGKPFSTSKWHERLGAVREAGVPGSSRPNPRDVRRR